MWSADIFDVETSNLVEGGCFRTYEGLRGWLVQLIGARPNLRFRAFFQIPADATESQRSVLETLGPARSAPN
jgi:hypothetical protein